MIFETSRQFTRLRMRHTFLSVMPVCGCAETTAARSASSSVTAAQAGALSRSVPGGAVSDQVSELRAEYEFRRLREAIDVEVQSVD